jgi:hypothetical protein
MSGNVGNDSRHGRCGRAIGGRGWAFLHLGNAYVSGAEPSSYLRGPTPLSSGFFADFRLLKFFPPLAHTNWSSSILNFPDSEQVQERSLGFGDCLCRSYLNAVKEGN